jgi:hypothetical protein
MTEQQNNIDVSEVLAALLRIQEGGEISVEEVKRLKWNVDKNLGPLIQRIYRKLIMFADDEDIRSRDRDYDQSWRAAFASFYEELNRRARMPKQQTDASRLQSRPLQVVLGTLVGSFTGAIWMGLTQSILAGTLTVGAIAFVSAVYFVMILVVFLVLGIPAYCLASCFKFGKTVPGLVYGLFLGSISSFGYGAPTTVKDLIFAVATFGFAGIISAGTFLSATQSYKRGQNV